MSSNLNSEIAEFQQFISAQIQSGEPPASPEECLSRYRALHPTDDELSESVEAIETALRQKANGEGKSLDQFDTDFRKRNQI